VSKIIIHWEND